MIQNKKKRIVVICPGRGSYTAESLGYLRPHRVSLAGFITEIDGYRKSLNEPTITDLDEMGKFSPSSHTRGEHASPLIYACSYADFMSINRVKFDVVAICGNSMGWYLTLAFAGALQTSGAFHLIQTMGSMMKENIIGGQMIYPIVNENWQIDLERVQIVEGALREVNLELEKSARELNSLELSGMSEAGAAGSANFDLEVDTDRTSYVYAPKAYVSIELGGYVVIGGDKKALDLLQKKLPKSGDYPFQLINHAAFHTPLLHETSKRAFESIRPDLFQKPNIPMIDGRGHIWEPLSTDLKKLYDYTLGHQVYAPYDFTTSIEVALKEFMPDHLVLLGPGGSLGGAIGQSLIKFSWRNMASKSDFTEQQKSENPFLLSMGMQEQRGLLF